MVRWMVVLGCLGALVVPATASAAPLPGMTIPGVTAERVAVKRGSPVVVMRFADRAAKAWRGFAGRRGRLTCMEFDGTGLWADARKAVARTFRLPQRRAALRVEVEPGFRVDLCTLETTNSRYVAAPVTALGRRALDEQHAAFALVMTGLFATKEKTGEPATVAEAIAASKGFVVALPGPEASPPADHGGYWRDGKHVVVAVVTSDGRRLFLDYDDATKVLRTNVFVLFASSLCDAGEIDDQDRTESCAIDRAFGFA